VSAIVVGTLSYALLGIACIATGVRTRRGIGKHTISRKVKVSYEELPFRERIRTSNALFALGAALLLCATFSLLPEPVMAVLFLAALFFFVLYVVIQRDLRRAAQEIARTKAG
jgi:hypothetical protein